MWQSWSNRITPDNSDHEMQEKPQEDKPKRLFQKHLYHYERQQRPQT